MYESTHVQDGATFKVKRTQLEKVDAIIDLFSKKTGFNFERVKYKAQYFRDVNNYIWLPEDPLVKPKLKGCFDDYLDKKGEISLDTYPKNHSSYIVKKALLMYFWKNIPIEETIYNATDIYDFCKMVKSKANKIVAEHYDENLKLVKQKQGKIVRYYVSSKSPVKLVKYLPPLKESKKIKIAQVDIFEQANIEGDERVSKIEAGHKITIFNKYEHKEFSEYHVNYQYYIDCCKKIIDAVFNTKPLFKPKHEQVSLF